MVVSEMTYSKGVDAGVGMTVCSDTVGGHSLGHTINKYVWDEYINKCRKVRKSADYTSDIHMYFHSRLERTHDVFCMTLWFLTE